MLKHKIQTIFEALLYIMLTYWLIDAFFAFNKYDWMLESGGNICSIPSVSGEDRILQAMIAAFFLLTPLIILILRKLFYAGNVRVLGICIFARYLSGLWLVAFLGTVYILLLVKSMRVVLTALIDREVTSLPSPQIHLVPHSQTQHSCHAIWRFAGQSIAQVHCR